MKRFNISLPDELVARIDYEAALRHMNRSEYIRYSCNNQSAADEFLRMQPDIQAKMLDLQDAISGLAIANEHRP